jgi:hypothetical protein
MATAVSVGVSISSSRGHSNNNSICCTLFLLHYYSTLLQHQATVIHSYHQRHYVQQQQNTKMIFINDFATKGIARCLNSPLLNIKNYCFLSDYV